MTPIYSTPWNKLQYGNQSSYTNVLAVNSPYAEMNKMNINATGRFISPLDIVNNRKVIVLGADIKFKSLENPVGEKVYINGQPFLVIGQLAQKAQLGGRRQNDAVRAFIPYSTYKLLMNPQKIDSFIIELKKDQDETWIENKIQTIVALMHHADPTDTKIVTVRNFSKRQAQVNDFFFGMQIFLGIVGALTLMVAGVGIANVMYASVSRATHEIGIRMAIGAQTYQILTHYIGEALLATIIGGAIGLIMALFLVLGINNLPLELPEWLAKIISRPEAILSWNVVVAVISVLGITGLLAGLFPALKASRVDPSEALRYE
jgi:putative ABC transport system permease protein